MACTTAYFCQTELSFSLLWPVQIQELSFALLWPVKIPIFCQTVLSFSFYGLYKYLILPNRVVIFLAIAYTKVPLDVFLSDIRQHPGTPRPNSESDSVELANEF